MEEALLVVLALEVDVAARGPAQALLEPGQEGRAVRVPALAAVSPCLGVGHGVVGVGDEPDAVLVEVGVPVPVRPFELALEAVCCKGVLGRVHLLASDEEDGKDHQDQDTSHVLPPL